MGRGAGSGRSRRPGVPDERGTPLPTACGRVPPPVERENAPDDLLADVWLAELARVLPELRDRYPDLPGVGGEEGAARTRLFETVARLGQALAEREPLVLFVDDVQWADAASLDVLHYAGRRWVEGATPALLLLTMRSEDLVDTPTLDAWLRGLARDAALTRMGIGPLTREATADFVRALAADGGPAVHALARWLFDETAGQPFFVVETLKTLMQRGVVTAGTSDHRRWVIEVGDRVLDVAALRGLLPSAVREAIHARLTRLTPAAGTLVAAAAVLGRRPTFQLLCQVANLGETEALEALDEALRTHLLYELEGTDYRFAHDKIREVVYADQASHPAPPCARGPGGARTRGGTGPACPRRRAGGCGPGAQ